MDRRGCSAGIREGGRKERTMFTPLLLPYPAASSQPYRSPISNLQSSSPICSPSIFNIRSRPSIPNSHIQPSPSPTPTTSLPQKYNPPLPPSPSPLPLPSLPRSLARPKKEITKYLHPRHRPLVTTDLSQTPISPSLHLPYSPAPGKYLLARS